MAEYRTAADLGVVRKPPMWARSMYNPRGLFTPSKEEEEAIRKRKEKERLIAEAQLRQQNASGLVANALAQEQQGPTLLQHPPAGPTQIQQPIVPGPSRTDQLNQAVLEKIQREGVAPEGYQYDVEIDGQTHSYGFDEPLADSGMEALREREGITADTAPVSNSDRLNQFSDEYLAKVGKRKKLLSGISGLFGVTDRSDEYEKNALAKYTDYVDNQAAQIALEGGLPATKVELISKHLKAGGSLESANELVESVWPAAATKPGSKTHFEMRDGVPMRISSDWIGGEWVETGAVPLTSPETNINIPGTVSESAYAKEEGKGFASERNRILGDNLEGNPRMYSNLRAENYRIDRLSESLDEGMETGFGTGAMVGLARALQAMFPPALRDNEFFQKWEDQVGTKEWWDATAKRFVGNMLAMTKGAISDREMKIFMGMIPALNYTASGNRRLLKMMKHMNEMMLVDQEAHRDLDSYALDNKTTVGEIGVARSRQLYDEFKEQRTNEAIARFYEAAEKMPADYETFLKVWKVLNPGVSDKDAKKRTQELWKNRN